MSLEESKTAILLMDRDFSRERLATNSILDLRNIDETGWNQIVPGCIAVDLRLYHLTIRSLEGIERLRNTVRLALEWAKRIPDLSPVFRMRWLQCLSVSDFSLLRSIEGIESLEGLSELHLSGNLGSLHPPLRLASVKPVARLANLKVLSLENLRLDDDDVTSIASLSSLRDLFIQRQFERAQLAYLAKKLNPQLKIPITAYRETQAPCPRCSRSMCVFTGRRMPILCRACDTGKFERLTRQFEKLMEN
jgi:hypothetical protein